ncbi:transforming growth factor beta activator LRRC32-like [Rhinophrynus dorsalis]
MWAGHYLSPINAPNHASFLQEISTSMDRRVLHIQETIMLLLKAGDEDVRKCKVLLLLHLLLAQSCAKPYTDSSRVCMQSSSEVNCQHLHMDSVPKNLSSDVRTLDLSHNFIKKLTNISLLHLHNLVNLSIGYNHIELIEQGALRTLTQLHSLNLAANKLHKYCLSHKGIIDPMKSLKILSLAENNLKSDMLNCYLTNSTSLEMLDLSGNNIVTLSCGMFDGLLQLSELDLSRNDIMEIEKGTFDGLQNLTVLNLAMNFIHCISSFDLTQLIFLNLSSNALEFFHSNDSQKIYRLKILDLSHNNLLHFPVLPKFQEIKHLNLSGNNMVETTPPSNKTLENLKRIFWLDDFPELDLFSAIENKESDLLHITNLDLSSNQLTSFPCRFLSNLRALQNLNLAHNCLKNMTEESFSAEVFNQMHNRSDISVTLTSLKVLDLQGNDLQSLPQWFFDYLPAIEQLNLKNNKIKLCSNPHAKNHICTNFSGALHLNYLNLGGNNIRQLPPHAFHNSSLVSLDVSENLGLEIQEGALDGIDKSLQFLSLKGNQMNNSQTKLPCLKMLKYLNLSYNNLTAIPAYLQCSQLDSIDFRHNVLHTLDENTALLWAETLTQMYISGNPFSCCSLKWLDDLQVAQVHIQDLDDTYCIYPRGIVNIRANVTNDHTKICSGLRGGQPQWEQAGTRAVQEQQRPQPGYTENMGEIQETEASSTDLHVEDSISGEALQQSED